MAFSVTTPIYYVNSDPHLGHAYTTVAGDVLARHHRRCGDDVFFLTGTDEHGGNVARAAEAAGLPPKEFCDLVSERFRRLTHAMDSTHDFFIRTTDPEHERRVQRFVQRLYDEGHLYEGTYAGFYCSSCEVFYAETDLVQPGNLCPIHSRPTEWVEEKNWFFPLSKWAPRLLELYDGQSDFVRPRARFNEARSLIAGGLEDVSFTRASVSWGVPVPWEPSQTIYVWVDALLNYLTAQEYGLGRDVTATFWPTSLHLMAKDILRLHGIVWPAMLMAAGYEPPRGLFVHGYFTSDGQKMSKTLGNV
ncbi:MAG: methionyl-tRNA synthetase, partial [Gaiellales bacterium]|nr:methionyl-tRNA synthetase [Gaiellales bacterium]